MMHTLPCEVGVVATLEWRSSGDPVATWTPVATWDDGTGPWIRPLDGLLQDDQLDEDGEYAAESARLDEHLGTHRRR